MSSPIRAGPSAHVLPRMARGECEMICDVVEPADAPKEAFVCDVLANPSSTGCRSLGSRTAG